VADSEIDVCVYLFVYRILSLRPRQLSVKVSNEAHNCLHTLLIEIYSGITQFRCDLEINSYTN